MDLVLIRPNSISKLSDFFFALKLKNLITVVIKLSVKTKVMIIRTINNMKFML